MSVASPYAEVTRRLPDLLAAGRQQAAWRGHPMLVSLTVAIPAVQPAVLFSRMQSQERILWEQPSQELSMVAFGAIARLTSHGTQRFAQISAGWCGLLSRTLVDAPPLCPLSAPVGLGGFAFDPARRADSTWEGYPDALLVLPRFLFVSYRGSSWLCVHELVAAECDTHTVQAGMDSIHGVVDFLSSLQAKEATPEEPEPSESLLVEQDEMQAARWKEKVRAIVGEIASGKLEKLVLARSVNACSPRPLNPGAVVRKLRSGYSHCTLFAFTSRQGCFVGATPERLVRLEGRTVRTDCLAGSTRRGTTDDEDRAFGQALLADCKERREHALVRRALRNVLEPLCVQLSAPETPGLLRLPNVQHLHTPLEGVLKQTNDIFALVAALHPTPATGGLPRETARSLLPTYEDSDRGWYAGPVGWVDGRGGGEFVVAIRSALLRGPEARLYAGCGIVAGSDPEREYAESCLKLKPMLWALNNTQT